MPPGAVMHGLAVEHARALLGSTDAGEIDLGIELASGLRLPEVQGDADARSSSAATCARRRNGRPR